MDQATIMRILERQGAPDTPENVNRIIQAAASDPSILERYSLGTAPAQMQVGPTGMRDIRGGAGMNDNAALLNLAQADTPAQIAQSQAPTPAAAPTPAPAQRRAPAPQPRRGVAPNTEPPPDSVPAGGAPGTPSGDDGLGVPWWLLPFAARKLAPKPTPNLPPPFVQEPTGGLPAHLQQRAPAVPEAQFAGRVPPRGGVTDVIDQNALNIGRSDPRAAGYFPPQPNNPQLPGPAPNVPPGPPRIDPSPGIDPATGKPMMKPGPGQGPQDVRNLYGDKNYENQQFEQRMLQEQIAAQEAARRAQADAATAKPDTRSKRPPRPGIR